MTPFSECRVQHDFFASRARATSCRCNQGMVIIETNRRTWQMRLQCLSRSRLLTIFDSLGRLKDCSEKWDYCSYSFGEKIVLSLKWGVASTWLLCNLCPLWMFTPCLKTMLVSRSINYQIRFCNKQAWTLDWFLEEGCFSSFSSHPIWDTNMVPIGDSLQLLLFFVTNNHVCLCVCSCFRLVFLCSTFILPTLFGSFQVIIACLQHM